MKPARESQKASKYPLIPMVTIDDIRNFDDTRPSATYIYFLPISGGLEQLI